MDADRLEEFEGGIAALERSLSDTQSVAAAFEGELAAMRSTIADTGREVRSLSVSIGAGLRRAFDGLVFDGDRLSDALDGVARSISRAAYGAAISPVTRHFGEAIGRGVEGLVNAFLPFAEGGSFAQGRVMPFARGGVVDGPVRFPMRGGVGLMGEAGPEAILPLARGADGRLGVRAEGGGRQVAVVMNVSTPDVAGFERARSQIADQIGRALARAERIR